MFWKSLDFFFFRMDDMKAARPVKRARLTVERTLAFELPDIIHYIYTFSHSCLLSWSLGKGKNVPDFSTVSPSVFEKSVKIAYCFVYNLSMQISYEMVSNAQVHQLTVSL